MQSLLNIVRGRVGNSAVIYGAENIVLFHKLFEAACEPEAADSLVRDKKNIVKLKGFQLVYELVHSMKKLRGTVWKERDCKLEDSLKCAAV